MIDELLQILFFVAFLFIGVGWTWGFHALFAEGHILEKLGDRLDMLLPEWITKPLFACPICESSIHGTAIFFFFIQMPLQFWPLFCMSLCGINFIINKLTEKLDD